MLSPTFTLNYFRTSLVVQVEEAALVSFAVGVSMQHVFSFFCTRKPKSAAHEEIAPRRLQFPRHRKHAIFHKAQGIHEPLELSSEIAFVLV